MNESRQNSGWSRGMKLGVTVGVAVHVAALALFSVKPPPNTVAVPRHAVIAVWRPADAEDNPALRERMALTDPKPLYKPTARNVGGRAAPSEVRRDPGDVFDPFGATFAFPAAELPPLAPAPLTAPATAVAALQTNGNSVFSEHARVDWPAPPSRDYEGWVVVRPLSGAAGPLLKIEVPLGTAPLQGGDWQPAELTCSVGSTGLTGLPVVTKSSGNEAIDGFLPGFLTSALRLGDRLPPGFFRVEVVR